MNAAFTPTRWGKRARTEGDWGILRLDPWTSAFSTIGVGARATARASSNRKSGRKLLHSKVEGLFCFWGKGEGDVAVEAHTDQGACPQGGFLTVREKDRQGYPRRGSGNARA